MYKVVLCTLFSVCFLPLVLFAQSVTIKGKVLDSATSNPLEFATVSVLNPDKSVIKSEATDKTGSFSIKLPVRTNFYVRIAFIGYSKLELSLQPESKEILLGNIILTPSSGDLNEITVTGQKITSSIQLNKQTIQTGKFSNTAGGTGLDIVQRLPSVTVNTDGNVLLRGSNNFLILINGKISNRTASEILSQLPANSIASVELITTPAANYDAEGKTGVINIITKKNALQGWSVTGNGMFGGVDPQRCSGDISLSYTKQKWNTFLSADYRRFDINGYRIGEVRTFYHDSVNYLPSYGIRPLKEKIYGVRGGFGFTPNTANILNVGYFYGYRRNDRTANLHYTQYIQSNPPYDLYKNNWIIPNDSFYNQNLFVRTGDFFTINSDYTHIFKKKQKLTLLSIYEYSVLGGPLRNQNNDEVTGKLLLKERSDEKSPLNAFRIQGDYTIPLSNNNRIDLGYQWRYIHHRGDFSFERLDLSTGIWEKDREFNDALDLKQVIHSGYFLFNGLKKSFQYNVGIRAEYMNRDFVHSAGNQSLHVEKFNLFPSAQGVWSMRGNQKIRLGYSRRIDRPTTRLMSPFKNHRHSEFIEVGDPTLLPEITDVLEFSYSKGWEKINLTASGYFNRIKDKIYRVNDVYSTITLLRTFTNAGNAHSYGLEFSSDIKANDWLMFYFSGNTYRLNIDGLIKGVDIVQKGFNYNLNGNVSADFNKKLKLQLDGSYLSRTITAQGEEGDLLLSNVGLRYLFNSRFTAGLLLQNIFQSNHQTITNIGKDFYVNTNYIKYDRVLEFTISIHFNDALKKTKAVKTEYGEKDF